MQRLALFLLLSWIPYCATMADDVIDPYWFLSDTKPAAVAESDEQQLPREDDEIKQAILSLQQQRQLLEKQYGDFQGKIESLQQEHSQLEERVVNLEKNPPPLHNSVEKGVLLKRILRNSRAMVRLSQQLSQQVNQEKQLGYRLGENFSRRIEVFKRLEAARRRQSSWGAGLPLQKNELQAEIEAYTAQTDALDRERELNSKELLLVELQVKFYQLSHQHLLRQQQYDRDALLEQENPRSLELSQLLETSVSHLHQLKQLQGAILEQNSVLEKINEAQQIILDMQKYQRHQDVVGYTLRASAIELNRSFKTEGIKRRLTDLSVQRSKECHELDELRRGTGPSTMLRQITAELTKSLVSCREQTIDELVQLDRQITKFEQVRKELQTAANRYLFWSPDVYPINLKFFSQIIGDLRDLLLVETVFWPQEMQRVATVKNIVLLSLALCLLIAVIFTYRRHQDFLTYAAARVGKVQQDNFGLTFRIVLWSLWASLPVPTLVAAFGSSMEAINQAIGNGIMATVPIFFALMVSANFSRPDGLFIKQFDWGAGRVTRAVRYYALAVWLAVPLLIITITFNKLSCHIYAATIGRLSFILFCTVLIILTMSLQRAGVIFYLSKEKSGKTFLNYLLWSLLCSAPLLAILFSSLGYLIASQQLLWRLELSVAIWFSFLIIYHMIRRWMHIQRRRIAFERAKQKRAEQLAQRARFEGEMSSGEVLQEVEEPVVDLDIISARSIQLLRSVITLATLISLAWLWSEIHPAFAFLGNVKLWGVDVSLQGVPTHKLISLGDGLAAIFVLLVTTQLVRNLPALLELALLQNLDLAPGTGYAITTLTKYLVTLIGGLFCISLLGIDWPRIQWVATGLGVSLGFGLKDIFANFIAGLILLFEKPIRIGDTVTIRGDITGTVTKINTRATVVTDWDRREIIMPNYALVTEQFINWTLSETVTRVVLQVPAPVDVESELVTKLIERALDRSTLALKNPSPEVYLFSLQDGVQCFEIRVYVAEIGHRTPLRHELHQNILAEFRSANVTMPYPPTQVRLEAMERGKGKVVTPRLS